MSTSIDKQKILLIHVLHKAKMLMYFRQSLHWQSLGFHCFVVILKAGNETIDLILLGIGSYILCVKYNNRSVFIY